MQRRICANLGFLLQIAGIITLLPIAVGLALSETQAVIAIFIPCISFLGIGFFMNALCEKKDLNFKAANLLFLLSFIVMPLIGALPYFYTNPFGTTNFADIFTNGVFESVSGFTTTGFSFIATPEKLPVSILIYRSLTELMGGVGIVFLLIAFFQSNKPSCNLGGCVGMENVNSNLRRTYLTIFAVYGAIVAIFIAVFYLMGFQNLVSTGTFVVNTLTGGYKQSPQAFQQYLSLAPQVCMIILMFFGAVNFAFVYGLVTRKINRTVLAEVVVFLIIIAVGTLAIAAAGNVGGFDAFFHVVSMSSSTGYFYLPLSTLSSTVISILLVLMLIGGCAFSIAGGIRISRLISFGYTVKEALQGILVREKVISKSRWKLQEDDGPDHLSASVAILLFIVSVVVFAVIFTTLGVSFTDALLEVGSAFTTNGFSLGYTTITMPVAFKWLMIVAMTIGRVEILAILIAVFSIGKGRSKPE